MNENPVTSEPVSKEIINYIKGSYMKAKRLDVRGTPAMKRHRLKQAIISIIHVEPEHIGKDFIEDILTICQGKCWSKEYDDASKELAKRINEEFDRIAQGGI